MAEPNAFDVGEHAAFNTQLAAKIPGKATCVEAWPRDEARGSRVLVGLADGTLLVVAPTGGVAISDVSNHGSQHGPRLQHADSETGSALGGGTAVPNTSSNSSTSGGGGMLAAAAAAVNGLAASTGLTGAAGMSTAASGGDSGMSGSMPTIAELPWRVQRAFKTFGGGRTLLQLQLSVPRSLLLSLCDQGVSVHRLPAFQLTCQATSTRYGKCFAWQEDRAMLCCVVKRRVHLLHYDGKDFLDLRDLAVAHSPLRMLWLGGRVLLAFQTGYALLNIESGDQTQLATMARGTPPAAVALASGEVVVALEGHSQIFSQDGKPTKRIMTWTAQPTVFIFSQPLLAALLPTRIEVRSLRVASKGRVLQAAAAAGLLGASTCSLPGGATFAVSSSQLWRLTAVPLLQQAEQLAAVGCVEEALDLCSLIEEPEQAQGRKALEDGLHVQLGHQLFASGAYEEAMVHFGTCRSANPVILLRLFPSLAPPQLLHPIENLFPEYKQTGDVKEPEGDAYRGALNMLLPYLLSWRTRLAAVANPTPASPPPASHQGADSTGAISAASATQQDAHGSDREPSSPSHQQEQLQREQQQGAQQQSTQQQQDKPLQAEGKGCGVGGPDLQALTSQQRQSLEVLLDTAVLQAMLALSDTGHLLRFVQRDNLIDLQAGRAALEAAGRYSELVALFRVRGCHDQALDLLHLLSQSPDQLPVPPSGAATDLVGLPGVWAAVKYMMAMGPSHLDLIKQHARWVLEADGEAGVDMFAQMEPPLAPRAALPIVSAHAPHLAVAYLEAALQAGAAPHAEFDTPLAVRYLQVVVPQPGEGEVQQRQQGLPPEVALERLKDLILASKHVNADAVLRLIPPGELLEVRALLLERYHRHTQILRIYLDELRRPELAEAYCDRVYARRAAAVARNQRRVAAAEVVPGASTNSGGATLSNGRLDTLSDTGSDGEADPGEIYLQLVQVYLNPSDASKQKQPDGGSVKGSEPGQDDAASRTADLARMLSHKHDRVDAGHALRLIPDGVPLAVMVPFLAAALQGGAEAARGAAIVRSLQRAANLAARTDLITRRQRSFVVTEERACGACFKRIGTSAVVASPDGRQLQHYSCYKRGPQAFELAPITPYT